MNLTVYLLDGGEIDVEDFEAETAMDLLDELNDPEGHTFLIFDIDSATVIVNRHAIARIDIEDPQ